MLQDCEKENATKKVQFRANKFWWLGDYYCFRPSRPNIFCESTPLCERSGYGVEPHHFLCLKKYNTDITNKSTVDFKFMISLFVLLVELCLLTFIILKGRNNSSEWPAVDFKTNSENLSIDLVNDRVVQPPGASCNTLDVTYVDVSSTSFYEEPIQPAAFSDSNHDYETMVMLFLVIIKQK